VQVESGVPDRGIVLLKFDPIILPVAGKSRKKGGKHDHEYNTMESDGSGAFGAGVE